MHCLKLRFDLVGADLFIRHLKDLTRERIPNGNEQRQFQSFPSILERLPPILWLVLNKKNLKDQVFH